MIMKMYLNIRLLRLLLFSVMCALMLPMGTSCNDNEEPDISIGYYLTIQPLIPIYTIGDFHPSAHGDIIGKITSQMKQQIDKVYPVPDLQGNDGAVIMACDSVYAMYDQSNMQSNASCVATLYRARMSGIVVKKSQPLKVYRF